MKKITLATLVAIAASFGANAQPGQTPCTGCTAENSGTAHCNVTVSMANALEIDCTGCGSLQHCANTISEWANGIELGGASYNVRSTKAYSVYAGTASNQMVKAGGGTPITIGTGPNEISLLGKVTSNTTGGTIEPGFNNAYKVIGIHTNMTPSGRGTKIISGGVATLTSKGAHFDVKTGPLPLNMANGDYSVNIVVAAIQD